MADDFDSWDDDPFGGDLDFDDDFDKPKAGFIRSFATGFLSGVVGKTVGDTDARVNTLKMVLPNTWLGTFSNVALLNQRRKEVMEEIKGDSYQTVQDLQYLAQRAGSKLGKGGPNKISDQLMKFSSHDFSDWEKVDYSGDGDSPPRMGETTDDEVKMVMEAGEANSLLERSTMETIADRTMSMMSEVGGRTIGSMNGMNRALVRNNQLMEQLVDFQRRVQARNDAMQLNVMTRMYLTNAKYYKFQEVAQHRVIAELKSIREFSKMSDYEKTSHGQAIRKEIRSQFFSTVKSKFGGISEFINDKFGKDARTGTVGAIGDVVGSVRMAAEMTEGMTLNLGDIAGNAAAGLFISQLPRIMKSGKAREYLAKFKKNYPKQAKWAEDAYKRMEDLGNVATYTTGNAAGLVNAMQRHYVGGADYTGHENYDEYLASLPPGAKPTPKLEWTVLNTLKKGANKGLGSLYENTWSSSGSRYSLTNRTLADSYEQSQWTRRSDRTLNEIIPQWLSQIHLSLEKQRTGDDRMKPMSYDYVKARFISHEQKVNNVVNKVIDRNSFSSVATSSNNITDTIDQLGLGALSPEAKKALSMELIMGSDKEEAFTPWNFLKLDEHSGVSPKVAKEIRRAMKAAFDITDDHINAFEGGSDADRIKMAGYLPTEKARKNVVGVADAVKSLGNLVPDIAAQLDIHKGTGSYDALKESGLITTDEYNRDDINMDMIKQAIASYIEDPSRRNPTIPDRAPLPTRPGSFGGFPYTVPTFGNRTPVIPGEESPEGVKVQGMDKIAESLGSIGDLKTAINNMGGPSNPLAQMLNLDPLNAGMTTLNEQVKRLVEMGGERNDLLTRILNGQPGGGKPPSSEDQHDVTAGKRSIIDRLKATNLKDMFNKGVDKLLDAQPLVLGGLLGGLAAYAFHDPKAAALLGGGAAVALAYGRFHSMSKAREVLDSEDLYEEGSDVPILEANKLANRNYYDATKGFLITSWKQITGSVKDMTNDTIIGARRLAAKLFTKENKEVLLSGLNKIRDFAVKAFKWMDPFGRAVALKDRIVNRFHQMDVYKEGESSPVLVGKRFAAGEYWKRGEGGEAVQLTGWHEIDGAVYDKNGDVIITQEEYDRGLKTSMGVSINKLGAAGKKFGALTMNLFNKAREKAGPAFGKAKDATIKALKADYSPIVNAVDRIYHLLLKHWGYELEAPLVGTTAPSGDDEVSVPVTDVKPPKLKVKLKATAYDKKPVGPVDRLEIPKAAQQPEVSPEELARRETEDTKPKGGLYTNVEEEIKRRAREQLGEQPNEDNRLNSRADKIQKAKEKKDEDAKDALIKMSKGFGFFGGKGDKDKQESTGIFGLLKSGLGAIAGGIFGLTKFFTGSWWNSFKILGNFGSIGIKTLPFIATGIGAIAKGIFTLLRTGSITNAGADTFDHLRGKKRTKAQRDAARARRRTPGGRMGKGGWKLGAGLAVGMGVDALVDSGFIDEGGALEKVGNTVSTAAEVAGTYQMVAGAASMVGVDIGVGAMAGMAGTALTASWGAVAPLLLNPYVLAALAIGAVGYGIYRYVKRGSGKQFDLRMTQYGVSDPDSDLAKKILQIEEKLTNFVVIGNGRASFSKDAPLQEIMKAFITDPNSKQEVGSIFSWFNGRFKPVYLTYMACLDVVKLKSLKEYDDAVSQDVYKVAKQVHQTLGSVMPFPYSIVAKIDPDTPLMGEKATVVRCNNLLDELRQYINRKTDTTTDAEAIKTPQGVESLKKEQANLQAVVNAPRGFFDSNDKLQAVIKAQTRLSEIDSQLSQLNSSYKVGAVAAQVFIKDLLPDNRPVDMLTGIRLACYGNDLDLTWRVEAVLKLERHCESLMVVAEGGAQFKGQVGDMFGLFKDSFRVDSGDADNWCRWFKDRFMPVLINYFNLIQNYRRGNPGVVWRSLSVTARYEIAKGLVETKVEPGAGLIVPIWNVRAAPFKDSVSPGKPDRVDRMLGVLGEASTTAKLKDPEKEAGKTNTSSWAGAISPHKTGGAFTTKQANIDDVSKARNSRDVALGGQYGTSTSRGSGTGNTFNLGGAYQTPGNSYGYQPLTGSSDTSHLDLSGVQAQDGQDNGVKVPKQLAEQLIIREMLKQGFTDPRAIAEMLALTNYETEGYGRTVENMRYTTPDQLMKTFREVTSLDQARALIAAGPVAIANAVYGGGKGQSIGNVAPGDGWRFRGRGLVQLTGRSMYARIGQQLGIDLVNNPELASNDPNVMAAIAVNYYKNSKLLQSITQDGNFGRAATGLNGGNELPGMPKRFQLYTSYLQQLQSGQLKADDAAAQGTNTAPAQGASGMYGGGGGSSPAPSIGGGNTPQIGAAPGGGSRNAAAYSTPPSLMAPGGGGADYGGNYGNAAPSEPGSLVGGGTGINSSGLRLKSGEAIAGGNSHPGITRLAQLIQTQVPNFRYFSALNDAFHKRTKPNSKHAVGLALDFTLTNGASGASQAIGIVTGILRTANLGPADFLLLNEYAKASAGATGGHVHVGFKSQEAADKFAQAAGASQPAGQDTTAGGTGATEKDQAYDPGQMPSAPPDTSTTPAPGMQSNTPAAGGPQVAPGAGGGAIPGPYTSLPLPGNNGSTANPNGPVAGPGAVPQPSTQLPPEGYNKPAPSQQANNQQAAPADPGGLMEKLTTVVGEGTGKQDTTNQLLQQIAGLLKSMESNSKPTSPAVTI